MPDSDIWKTLEMLGVPQPGSDADLARQYAERLHPYDDEGRRTITQKMMAPRFPQVTPADDYRDDPATAEYRNLRNGQPTPPATVISQDALRRMGHARAPAPAPVQPPPPRPTGLTVLGGTMNGLVDHLQMAPDAAALITRQLYAPVLNHPQMRQITQQVAGKVKQLAAPSAGFVKSTAQAAAPAPQPPQISELIPHLRGLRDAASTLHVIMSTPQPTNWDVDSFVGNASDNDSGSDVAGAIRDGIYEFPNAMK